MTPLRFSASGGDAYENIAGRLVRLSLLEARGRAEGWMREGLIAQERGDAQLARVYGRDAMELQVAISLAHDWRVAAGWSDPFTERAA